MVRTLKIIGYSILTIIIIVVIAADIYAYKLYKELSPQIDSIVNYNPPEVTQIYDRKNRLIANIYDTDCNANSSKYCGQFRFYAKYDEIPGRMVETLLAVEDTLFFEHGGVNIDAILRAGLKNIIHMRYAEGGSTLTQQLVKNILLNREKNLERKFKEMLLSIRVEQVLTKEQILERYLNSIYFGSGYYGVKTAALGYFHKDLKDLSLKEMAMLAALPKSPVHYDPTRHLGESLKRANVILERMKSLGWISEGEFREGISEIPTVYNQNLTKNKAPYVVDEVLRILSPKVKDLKTGGYKIYLTLDLDYQNLAQASLKKGYENIIYRHIEKVASYRKRHKLKPLSDEEIADINASYQNLNGAFVATNPHTGEVLALVGGIDHAKSPFNRATQAKRQLGSAIKPFIYLMALNAGYSTASHVPDAARRFDAGDGKIWQPKNYSRGFYGFVTLQYALQHSLNISTINLSSAVGFNNIYKNLTDFGFYGFQKDPSVVLGSLSISPLEAAKQYSLFSNGGVIVDTYLIRKIVAKDGTVREFVPISKDITTKEQAYLVTSILKDVVQSGTGKRARVEGIDIAGKTGTSNDIRDAWFSAFTPSVQLIVWYGRDNNTSIGSNDAGGVIAAPVAGNFIKNLLLLDPSIDRRFKRPQGVHSATINGVKYDYTNISPLPRNNITDTDKVLF
ncbi:PBP1A family penicillin-binding protein [Helicobacter sp. 11S02629-2]|uniref:penicillin-binding protein 1A n=1 Tax=Helicobacter sp. 11S02629-2 TaxID=1476195 RepID=UPI000BA6B77C|nr:PBP1A family penicillin-binding protein [Helicobacter sp. 11S02629-2]PAF45467.1 penicillin-binding protein [Helicobacter sp. 11S02629-2]